MSRQRRSIREPGTTAAGKAMIVVAAGLLTAGLLNSTAMVRATDDLPPGWRRTAVRVVVVPVGSVARVLRLDRPRSRLDTALGRTAPTRPPAVVRRPLSPRAARQWDGKVTSGRAATPTRARPLRLLVTGDSMIERMGPVLINSVDDRGTVKGDVDVNYGTGLVRPDHFDWPAHAATLAKAPADVTIVMLGGNDGQNIAVAHGRLDVGTRKWRKEYASRAGAVMDTLAADGRRVFWIGLPMPRSEKMQPMFATINQAVRQAAAGRPRVTFVDIWRDYAPDGRYTDVLRNRSGRQVKVRGRDGIHLSKEGADMLAAKVRTLLRKEWAI